MNYDDLKIGKLVQTVLRPLIISKATEFEVMQMQDAEYSKNTFGIQYPLLLKTNEPTAEKHYYSDLFVINGETYRLCCEWFETKTNNDRPYVEKWIREHEGAESAVRTECTLQEEKRAQVEDFSDLYEAFENKKEEPVDLYNVMAGMDPVAFHSEYYDGMWKCQNTLVNGGWLCVCPYGSKPYIMDENGENKVELNIENIYTPIGMNNRGIWSMDFHRSILIEGEYEWWNRFICFYPQTGEKRIIKFNDSKAVVRDTYIYEDNIYYVGEMPGGSKKLVKVDALGKETVLYRTHKGEGIAKICADGTRVVLKMCEKDAQGYYWCIMDTNGWNPKFIGKKRNPKNDYLPFIEIKLVDLKYNIMWTTMTEAERFACKASEKDLIARSIGEVEEFGYLIYKDTNEPGIFKDAGGNENTYYFDGIDKYVSLFYTELHRIDSKGNKQELNGGTGHGETQKFLVNDYYIFVNYDAEVAVRLPRKFTGREVDGCNNPEAELIFGDMDYRL